MAPETKGRSPFYPGQPVPVELFVGRQAQIDRIIQRGIGQVAAGKPIAIFVQGEYGIGKSSIAGYVQHVGRQDQYGLFPIYASLGGRESIEDVGLAIVEATVKSGDTKVGILDWLSKYVSEVSLAGVKVKTDALQKDAPQLTAGLLPFLGQLVERLGSAGVKGLFIVLDEVDSLARQPHFAHFIKGLVDTNAMSATPVPILLMVCGVEDARRQMITLHQPVERIFDIIDIERMSETEMRSFYFKAFNSVNLTVDPLAMSTMIENAGGFPKLAHLVGDAAYWVNSDSVISHDDALQAVINAADDVGKKYVDQQVIRALRSRDYRSILLKLGALLGPYNTPFKRAELAKGLTANESAKLNNFIRKMEELKVIKKADERGAYLFHVQMVRVYIWLNSFRAASAVKASAVAAADDVPPVPLGSDEGDS